MTYILLLLIWTTLTTTSTMTTQIQIHDLTNNPGLVSLRLGFGRIKIGSHKIFHTIDITPIKPIIIQIRTVINNLKIFDVRDSMILLNKKLDMVEQTYTHLLPISRNRRGLFDGLGSVIKLITGNLDNNDLIKINRQFNEVLVQNKALANENNEQISINHKVQDRLNRMIKIVNDQQKIIQNNFIKFRENILNERNISTKIEIVKEIFNLNINIDLLSNHINKIFEAIQISKIKIISKDILTIEELNVASKILENENIYVESIDQVIEYLDLAVIHHKSKIVFIILIPLLRKEIFEHQLLEAIVKESKVLDLHFAEALNCESATYLISGECTKIGQSIICSEQHVKDVSKDSCYSKLLKGSSGKCDLIEASMESHVKRISSNYVIITGDESIPLTSNCGLSDRNVSGNTLIFFQNCTLTVNHTSFTDIEYVAKQQPVIIPMNGLQIIGRTINTNFTLQKLKEVNLHTRQQLHALHRQQKTTTLGTSLAIFIVVTFLILYIARDKVQRFCRLQRTHVNVPGRSVLQEGLVTERTRPLRNQHLASSTIAKKTSSISILPSPTSIEAQQTAASKPETTTTTTTTTRLIGTMRTADTA